MTPTAPGNGPVHASQDPVSRSGSDSLTTGEKSSLGGLLQAAAVVLGGAALLKVCVFDDSGDGLPMLFAALIVAAGLFFWGDSMATAESSEYALDADDASVDHLD